MTSGTDNCLGIATGEYEVSKLVDICYGDPNKTGKRGLNFKVKCVISLPEKIAHGDSI